MLIDFIRKRIGAEFTRNILTVLGGSSFSTLFPLLCSPLLTRLFDPSLDFAPFALYSSFTFVVASIANSHYTSAIMVADNDEDSKNLFFLSGIVNIACFLILLGFLFFFRAPLLGFLNAPISFYQTVWLVPFTVLITGIYANFLQWSYRKAQFKRVAVSRVFQSFVSVTAQIILGLFFKGGQGLIIGYFLGQLVSLLALAWLNLRNEKQLQVFALPSQIKDVKRKYRNFFLFQTPADLINVVTQQMPTFFLSRYALPLELGWYGFAYRILVAPSSIIVGAIGDVFKQKASQEYILTGNANYSFRTTVKTLFTVMILPSFLVLLFGPWFFEILFGAEWKGAGIYSQIMMIMFFPKFVVSPLSYMYVIARRQKEDFYLHIFILLTICISLFAGFFYYRSTKSALLLFSINYCLIYLIYFLRSLKFAKGE